MSKMNRLKELFEGKKENILSVFYTAGFPKLHDTVTIAKHLEKAGADIIEIGIPFQIRWRTVQPSRQAIKLRWIME